MSTQPILEEDKKRIQVQKPKSADPAVKFKITVKKPTDERPMNIRYVWGTLQMMRADQGGNPDHLHAIKSSGDEPLDPTKEHEFDMIFEFDFDDKDWKVEKGKFIDYFLTLTCHDDRDAQSLLGYSCSGKLEVYSNGKGVFGPDGDDNKNTAIVIELPTEE